MGNMTTQTIIQKITTKNISYMINLQCCGKTLTIHAMFPQMLNFLLKFFFFKLGFYIISPISKF